MKKYKGVRTLEGCIVTVDDAPLDARNNVRNHSPAGFNWGYCGSGPAQLALALLCDALRHNGTAQLWYQDFKRERIACIQADTWSMTDDSILEWLFSKVAHDLEIMTGHNPEEKSKFASN